MNWEEYSAKFTEKALKHNFEQDYVKRCLEYASNLCSEGFPIIYDINHLSLLVGYKAEYVIAAAYGKKAFYREFKIRKKSGGERTISEPLPSLKEIQRWILDNILYVHQPSRYAKGFVPKLSIKDNARFHRAQPKVLSLDLKDFFPTVKRYRVYGVFRSFNQ
jgi:RNA-directed DNA polymerase